MTDSIDDDFENKKVDPRPVIACLACGEPHLTNNVLNGICPDCESSLFVQAKYICGSLFDNLGEEE